MVLRVRVAFGSFGSCCTRSFCPHGWRQHGRHALGHLGHLGHGFNLQAGAGGWLALGHLGHCFLVDPNDPKHGHAWHAGAKALGHLGHLVIVLKLVAGDVSAWRYSPTRY